MENTKENKQFSWWDFIRAVWYCHQGQQGRFIFWTVILFAVFFYQLIPPIIVGKIIDFFTGYKPGNSLLPFFIYAIVLAVSYGVVAVIRLTSKNKLANLQFEASYNMKTKGFDRLLDFSLKWHDSENTGNKVQRILTGLNAFMNIRKLISQHGFETITAFVGIVVIFMFLNPIFVVFLLIYMTIFTTINVNFYKRQQKMQTDFNKAQEKASGTYYEGLNNVLTIKTLGVKDTFKKNIYNNEFSAKEFSKQIVRIANMKWKIFQVFNACCILIYLLMMGQGFLGGTITLGAIFLYYTYLMKLIDAAGYSTDIFEESIEYKSAFSRMMPIYWEDQLATNGDKEFPKEWNSIEISQGKFSYKKSPNADDDVSFEIKDLNFKVEKFQKVGVAGASGGGKSTLAKLLLGLYQLEGGTFTIEKTNFYDIKHDEITKKIAIVLQESEMFNLSMQENITLMRKVKPELLAKAVEIAQLNDLISKLPEGLATQIGEKGYRISGGERQRIGIARAICKDPEIFVFDEATSALDNKTEFLIQEALEKELEKKTIITIAHRVTTLKHADKICVFDKGRIVEEGIFNQLVANPKSKFFELTQMQKKKSS